MDSPRVIVVLGDLHCGSTVALCPPDFQITDGGKHTLNAAQEWIWEQWLAFNAWLEVSLAGRSYVLVVNGDAGEGVHHHTKQLVSLETCDHCAMAVNVLRPLADGATETLMVRGTETHVGASDESGIGAQLGARQDTSTGRFAADEWELTMNGVRVAFRHHMVTSKRKYLEASGLGIELGNQQLERARTGGDIPQVICAAHRHRFGLYSDAFGMMVVGAPWQLSTQYAHKVVPGATPTVGAYLLDFGGKDDGQLPDVRAWVKAMPMPEARRVVL